MAEAKTSLRDPARLCATRHAIAEAPPARRQAADDPRRSEGSGFYKRNSAVRIGEAPSDAVPRRPATAPRSQARSHDITVTSGLTGAPDPRVKRSSVTFRASKPPFLSAGTESANPPPSTGESANSRSLPAWTSPIRLRAGGKWIRTLGPAQNALRLDTAFLSLLSRLPFCQRDSPFRDRGPFRPLRKEAERRKCCRAGAVLVCNNRETEMANLVEIKALFLALVGGSPGAEGVFLNQNLAIRSTSVF